MAKKSLINRNAKRIALNKKYEAKRENLKKIINDINASEEDKDIARMGLQKLPRNSSPYRIRNRCALTGRSRGNFRYFSMSRIKIREHAFKGDIPGVIKASW